jgi:hypothetical protein
MRKKRWIAAATGWIAAGMIAVLALPGQALSWGVMGPYKTHQHILGEAYRLLQADPAFDPLKFPSLEQVMAHEGVDPLQVKFTGEGTTGLDAALISGPGPDSAGNSPYSWHYYNPYTKEGRGPEAVQRFYRYLALGMLKPQSEALPKAAAWSAHFLADMYCPYHINGSYRETIVAIKARQLAENRGTAREGAVYLDEKIKGSSKLSYRAVTPVKSWSDNFRTEIDRFLATDNDWFDPWYYNGDYFEKLVSNTSSHILWEATVSPGAYSLQGYAPGWRNAGAAIEGAVDAQGRQAYNLAVKAAFTTREQIDALFDDPSPAVNEAIRSVYSLWRASFSAMRLELDVKQDGEFLVATGTVANRGGAPLQQVAARLSASHCDIVSARKTQDLGNLPSGAKRAAPAWRVRTGDKPCRLTMDAVCRSPVPDLQYASLEYVLTPKPLLKVVPDRIRLSRKDRQEFKAFVQGKETKDVTWSVREGPRGGSVTDAGVYTPGAGGGAFTVVATSRADSGLRGEAAVLVSEVSLDKTRLYSPPGRPVAFRLMVAAPPAKPQFAWNYGDGSPVLTNEARESTHVYAQKGTFRVSVKMIDGASGRTVDEAVGEVIVEESTPAAAGPAAQAFELVHQDSFAHPALPKGCRIRWNQGQKANDAVHESTRRANPEKYPDYYLFTFRMECPGTAVMETGSLTVPYRAKPLEYKVDAYYSGDGSPCVEVTLKYMPGHRQADLIKIVEDFNSGKKQYIEKYKSGEKGGSFSFPGWNAAGNLYEEPRGGFSFVGLGENGTVLSVRHFSPMVQFRPRDGSFFPNQQCMNQGRYCNNQERKTSDDYELSEKNKRIDRYQQELKKRALEFVSGMRVKGLAGP